MANAATTNHHYRGDKMTKRILLDGMRSPRALIASNDNNPERVTRFVPYNGGCSTTSGMTAVTLPRVPSIDGQVKKVAA